MITLPRNQGGYMRRFAWFAVGIFAVWNVASASDDDHLPHWSYAQGEGPAQWAELSPEFALCGEGREQSPIDLRQNPEGDLASDPMPGNARMAFEYRASPLRIVRQSHIVDVLNSGHTIQVNPEGESALDLDGGRFRLVQYHFHAPSEHTLDGRRFPMELHAVHQSESGELAVVGIFIESGAAHPTMAKLWAHIPEEEGLIDHHEDVEISPGAFLPNTVHVYRYSGSLTTPPCNEKVRWAVIAEPIEFSQEQIETFEKFYSGNNRPLQPLNGRKVEVIEVDRSVRD
jgi:carbonic anhydrase